MIGIFCGLLMKTFDKVSVRLSFSTKHCSEVAEKSHEIFSFCIIRHCVYFWVLKMSKV